MGSSIIPPQRKNIVESGGGKVNISGSEALSRQPGPLVYIANHMSFLETFILSGIALVFNRVAFVFKKKPRHYPDAWQAGVHISEQP